MTRGSWIHDDISGHLRDCAKCRETNPEAERLRRPSLRDVSDETLAARCPEGRSIYRAYLRWIAEPE